MDSCYSAKVYTEELIVMCFLVISLCSSTHTHTYVHLEIFMYTGPENYFTLACSEP